MAERRVSTRFAVEGESQVKAALKSLNSEYKVLKSELKLADTALKTQGKSIDALNNKIKPLDATIKNLDASIKTHEKHIAAAREAQQKWANLSADTKAKIDQLKNSTDSAGKETDEYKEELSQLQAALNRYNAAEERAKAQIDNSTIALNKAKESHTKYKAELDKTQAELKELEDALSEGADAMEEMVDGTNKAEQGIDALSQALVASGVVASIKEVAEALHDCVDASVEYESAMAGVAKTTNLGGDDLKEMAKTFQEMATQMPASATELANIAEIAGQLGVPSKNLERFTEVMAQLATATNMTSEEAATMIAQFAAITGMDLTQVDRLGASIVALGNNFATNESRITDMSQSIAGAATNAGMAETDMLALSAAVTSLGIEAGMGGTNMSKLISSMQTAVQTGADLERWASVAGMSAAEFAALWGKDATSALLSFTKGLGAMGSGMTLVLGELDIGEERFARMVTSLANAEASSGMLTRALSMSNTAWTENTALVKEAETRYATTESKVKMFDNSMQNLRTTIGDQLTPALGNLADTGTDMATWANDVVQTTPGLVSFVTTLLSAGAAFVGLSTVLPVVTRAWGSLNSIITANPWMLTASAIAAVVAALATLYITTQSNDETLNRLKNTLDGMKDSAKAYEEATAEIGGNADSIKAMTEELSVLAEVEGKSAAQKALMKASVDELNSAIPELCLEYDELNDTLSLTAAQIAEITDKAAEQAQMQADIERIIELKKEQAAAEREVAEAQEHIIELQNTNPVEAGTTYKQIILETQEYQAVIDETLTLIEENRTKIAELESAYNSAANAVAGYSETEAPLIDILTEQSIKVDELMQKFTEMGTSAMESAEQAAGSLTNVVEVVDVATSEVIAALETQTQFFNEYAENIKRAAEMGVDEGLIAKLSDGSIESAEILAGIVSEGERKIAELNEAFRKSEEGKAAIVEAVRTANAEASTELDFLVTNVNECIASFNQSGEATANGRATMNGLISGLQSKLGSLQSVVNQINSITASVGSGSGGYGHAAGIGYVPYNEYPATLHKGEMVLTALQAEALRAQARAEKHLNPIYNSTNNTNNSRSISIGKLIVPISGRVDSRAARAAGEDAAYEIERKLRYRGIL